MKSGFKKFIIFIIVAAAVAGIVLISDKIFETNNEGFYQIKQAFISGKMTVRNEPGTYFQLFGKITEYRKADTYFFSKDVLDGGSGAESDPITVRFSERAEADISGSIIFRMPTDEESQLRLHRDFETYDRVVSSLIRQIVPEAIKNTAAIMKADESYADRKPEFTSLAERQIREGIFETYKTTQVVSETDGSRISEDVLNIRYNDNGNPVIIKESPLKKYNIEIVSFTIKDIDFDDMTDLAITKLRDAEQKRVVAIKLAETARQDAITAEEEGKARIAVAKAEEEVTKIREVVQAQKEMEVAQLNAEKAAAEARADFVKREAEANANALLVKAGLTPSERARLEKEIAVGIAAELAKIKLPEIMSFGADSDVGNPFEAIGLDSMLDVIDRIKARSALSGR